MQVKSKFMHNHYHFTFLERNNRRSGDNVYVSRSDKTYSTFCECSFFFNSKFLWKIKGGPTNSLEKIVIIHFHLLFLYLCRFLFTLDYSFDVF